MNIGNMKENEMICVIIDLWRSLVEEEKGNILIDYLKRNGLEDSEIDEYIESLNKLILEP